ncbi:MAG: PKD domain-containing protein [Candidatus Marinimicrobia bacterium]|nr:PKD domain-containing protein [Candidatus Neomarinimicrobiota bacterium]
MKIYFRWHFISLKFILLTLIILSSVSVLHTQSYKSNLYYEGTGEAETLEKAKELALADLSRNIETFIFSLFQTTQEEKNLTITEDYVKSQIKTYSSICLRNVEFHNSKKKKTWVVRARVLKSEVKRVFEERKINIRTMLKSAIHSELSGDISTALKNYYWSYILSFSYPDTIIVSLPPYNVKGNARTLLVDKINNIFKGIRWEIYKSYVDGEDFVVILNFYYRENPIIDMQFYYYNGSEQDWGQVVNGKAYLVLNGDFSGISRKVCLEVEYKFESEMPQNKDVQFIYNALDFPKFDNSILIPIDLSEYVKFDFVVNFKGKTVTFLPKMRHLSISTIKWDFGDGQKSNIQNPIHTYPDTGIYLVKVEINNDRELSISKKLNLSEKTIENVYTFYSSTSSKGSKNYTIISEKTEKDVYTPINQLMNTIEINQFIETVKELSKSGKIVFGSSKDFESKEGLYYFVFDRENNQLEAIYIFKNSNFINIDSGESSSSLKEKYRGRKMAGIWVEVVTE